jgi:prevent-host-death family protein
MSSSSIVGSRELKTRLGQYLNRVRRGETLLVTDRDEPVAELRPVGGSADPVVASLRKLAAGGAVTLPVRRATVASFAAIRSRGASASAALSSDRDERG